MNPTDICVCRDCGHQMLESEAEESLLLTARYPVCSMCALDEWEMDDSIGDDADVYND